MLEGETEDETSAKVEAFVRGDRGLLIRELEETIAHCLERVAECAEKGNTDSYWKRVAEDYRARIPNLKAMLGWAQATHCPSSARSLNRIRMKMVKPNSKRGF